MYFCLTDWTKDDSEDDKFWEWMDKDKETHKRKYPSRVKKPRKKKKIILSAIIGVAITVIIFGIISSTNEFSSEKYFYISDYRLNKSPVFCAQEFSDPVFPDAEDTMIEKTSQAIQQWQDKINQYTDSDGWKFEYRTISEDSSFANFGCDATIIFEPLPPPGREVIRGETAPSHYGFSDVVIFYLDPVSRDRLDPNVDIIIMHEIGHVLGLGHPIFEGMYDSRPFYVNEDEKIYSRSIMITPEVYPFLPADMIYTITDYDVRAVVNLYGGGISNSPIFFGYLNYIIIAAVLFGIAFYVNKKLKGY